MEERAKAIVCLALQQENQNQVLKAVETLLFLGARLPKLFQSLPIIQHIRQTLNQGYT